MLDFCWRPNFNAIYGIGNGKVACFPRWESWWILHRWWWQYRILSKSAALMGVLLSCHSRGSCEVLISYPFRLPIYQSLFDWVVSWSAVTFEEILNVTCSFLCSLPEIICSSYWLSFGCLDTLRLLLALVLLFLSLVRGNHFWVVNITCLSVRLPSLDYIVSFHPL